MFSHQQDLVWKVVFWLSLDAMKIQLWLTVSKEMSQANQAQLQCLFIIYLFLEDKEKEIENT